MNPSLKREVVALGTIGLSVCVGAHWWFVDPASRALAAQKAEVLSIEHQITQTRAEQAQSKLLPEMSARIEHEKAQMSEASRLALDEAELYSKIMGLGEALGVRVDRSEVARKPAPVGRVDAAPAGSGANASRTSSVRYQMNVTGTYAAIVAFVQGLQSDIGYCLVRSVDLRPLTEEGLSSAERLVSVQIESEHFAFDPMPRPTDAASSGEPGRVRLGGPMAGTPLPNQPTGDRP